MEEETNTYTVQRTDKKRKEGDPYNRRLIILIIAAIALLVVLAIVIGKYAGMSSAKKEDEKTSSSISEEQSSSEEPSSEVPPTELYSEGEYYISTGGVALKFRKDHSTNSDVILEIKDGTKLTITEVYHDENAANESLEYWGKTSYYGYDGWVAMSYLKNAFSGTIITPEEMSSSNASSTSEPSSTNAPAEEPGSTNAPAEEPGSTNKPAEEPSSSNKPSEEPSSSAENTTAAPSSPYTPGDYTVATGGSTLSFRKSASASAEKIMGLTDGTKLTVTRIVDAGGTDETTRYWGEVTHLGYTGYVSMYYLNKASN